MNTLRVNMTRLEVTTEKISAGQELIGGRCLTAKILNKEVSPGVDPLSADAKLVIATGPLAGTNASSLGRLSFGAKSPLTHGIKESNVVGPLGAGKVGNAGGLGNSGVVGRHGLALEGRYPVYSQVIGCLDNTVPQHGAELRALFNLLKQFVHPIGITHVEPTGRSCHTQGTAQFDGVDADVVDNPVELGYDIRVGDTQVGPHQGDGFIFKTGGDMIAVCIVENHGTANEASRHAGIHGTASVLHQLM